MLCVVSFVFCFLDVGGELYSSVSRMKDVARHEIDMFRYAMDYLEKEKQRLEKIER